MENHTGLGVFSSDRDKLFPIKHKTHLQREGHAIFTDMKSDNISIVDVRPG